MPIRVKPQKIKQQSPKNKAPKKFQKTTYQKFTNPNYFIFLLSATKFHLQRHVPKVARALSKIITHVDDLNSIGDYLKILGKIHHQNGIKVCKSKGTDILGWWKYPYVEKRIFQLLDIITTELKSHMTCFNSMPLMHPFILCSRFLQFLEIWLRNLVREIWFENSGWPEKRWFYTLDLAFFRLEKSGWPEKKIRVCRTTFLEPLFYTFLE